MSDSWWWTIYQQGEVKTCQPWTLEVLLLRGQVSVRVCHASLTDQHHDVNQTLPHHYCNTSTSAPSRGGGEGFRLPSNTWFLGPTRVFNPDGILIDSAVFAQLTIEWPYTLQWAATSSPKIAPSTGGIGAPSQMASRSAQPFLQELRTW